MAEKASTRSILWQNFFRKQDEEESSLSALLSRVPIFSDLTGRELGKVGLVVHHREYDANEYVFSQGDPGLGMYVIEEGRVEIVCADKNGTERRLASLKAGDFFGELSLLDESVRSASAVAKTELKIIGFFRPDLLGLLNRSPKLGTKILLKLGEVIGTRLRITNEEISNLSTELELNHEKKRGGSHADSQS
ncbi:MAG: cyclic nucleotide-binding domain-containing protein [Bacteroidetes bacterium]|nr:cyclic nucleotide-binding domain-containing protein [Bacteroidota bacterium]